MEMILPPTGNSLSLVTTVRDLAMQADPIVKGVMLLLVLASVVCWAIILEKALRLSAFSAQIKRLERFAANPVAAANDDGLTASLAAAARRQQFAPGETRLERETRLEKAMRLAARAELNRLQPRMRFLATTGSTAPFIGLFGTVWGIMNSFTAIAAQKDTSLAVVAPGIAEALLATALGLLAAIPAVVAYNQIAGAISRAAERISLAVALLAEKMSSPAQDGR